MEDLGASFAAAQELQRTGRLDRAAAVCRRILEAAPGHPEVLNLLGVALLGLGRDAEASATLGGAVAGDPARADFRVNLATALHRAGEAAAGLAELRRALAIEPWIAEAWFNLAHLARRAGRVDDAVTGYRRGLAIDRDDARAQAGLGGSLYEGGHGRAAVAAYRRSLALDREPVAGSGYLYVLEFDAAADPATHQRERRRWAHAHLPASPVAPAPLRDPDPERPLAVGFFAPNFDNGNALALESFLRHRDPTSFRTTLYSGLPARGEVGRSLESAADSWRVVGDLDDEALDSLIRTDAIDVLVDTANHVGGHRLAVFARKPAPILITGWAHGTGTGMRAFDFIADDRFTIPDHERQLYVEEVLEIPRRATFPPPRHSPPVTPSPCSLGRPFTFGHLGRLAKVTDETLAIWRRVLLGMPGSRLVLKADVEAAGSRFRQVLDRLKADVAADRISVIGPKDRLANMADYGAIDLTLDTAPLAGPLTVWESLWMGVPAVALRGTTQSARASVSILASCGMEAFVADDAEAYVAVALRAACVPSTLIPLRAELRGRLERSEACDPHRAAASMSEALRTAWRRRCARRDRAFPSGKADRPRSAP